MPYSLDISAPDLPGYHPTKERSAKENDLGSGARGPSSFVSGLYPAKTASIYRPETRMSIEVYDRSHTPGQLRADINGTMPVVIEGEVQERPIPADKAIRVVEPTLRSITRLRN